MVKDYCSEELKIIEVAHYCPSILSESFAPTGCPKADPTLFHEYNRPKEQRNQPFRPNTFTNELTGEFCRPHLARTSLSANRMHDTLSGIP
jgi:hypothetical protein